jgi:hypothetical protein
MQESKLGYQLAWLRMQWVNPEDKNFRSLFSIPCSYLQKSVLGWEVEENHQAFMRQVGQLGLNRLGDPPEMFKTV